MVFNTEIKLRYVLMLIVVFSLAIFVSIYLVRGKYRSALDKANSTLALRDISISKYKIKVDSLQEYVTQSNLITISKDKELKQVKEIRDRLKALNVKHVNTIGELRLTIAFLQDSIPSTDTVTIIKEKDGNYIKLPLAYKFKDKWVSVQTKVGDNGLGELSFNMNPSPINVIIGEQRMGLFKPLEDKVFITTPNSYIEFDKSQFIVIDNTPSPYTYLGLGAVGGLSIAILLGFLIN